MAKQVCSRFPDPGFSIWKSHCWLWGEWWKGHTFSSGFGHSIAEKCWIFPKPNGGGRSTFAWTSRWSTAAAGRALKCLVDTNFGWDNVGVVAGIFPQWRGPIPVEFPFANPSTKVAHLWGLLLPSELSLHCWVPFIVLLPLLLVCIATICETQNGPRWEFLGNQQSAQHQAV